MSFPPSFLDELRNRVPLADVIGRKAKLIRRGREYVALCPFHNEKTPSFTVSEDKGFYHCFGCGAHGDVISFLVESEGLPFPEAVARLAAQAGLELPEQTPQDREREERQRTLVDALEAAARWFTANLSGQAGAAAQKYIEGRGITSELAGQFRLGFAPDRRDGLKAALQADGLDEDLLVEAGLLIRPDDGGDAYDRFRDRLMFPISDRRGRVIAFGGRALGDARAKYLNSPETPVFHKGDVLYNLNLAAPAMRETGAVVVVEGYMDVIALARAGITHGVAPLGTALTENQIKMLWRLVPEPVICFDGDEAGQKASNRAAERALPMLQPGYSLGFAVLPRDEDPDSLLTRAGAGALQEVLSRPVSLSDRVWDMLTLGRTFDTPERRAGLLDTIHDTARIINDRKVGDHYRQYLVGRFEAAYPDPRRWKYGSKAGKPKRTGGEVARIRNSRLGAGRTDETLAREQVLVLTVLNHPSILERIGADFESVALSIAELDKLRNEIIGIAADSPDLASAELKTHICQQQEFSDLIERVTQDVVARGVWQAQPDAAAEDAEEGWRHTYVMHLLPALRQELDFLVAQSADVTDENHERLLAIQAEIKKLENQAERFNNRFGEASGRQVLM